MSNSEPGTDEPSGEIQFRGTAIRSQKAAEPDTEVIVTDEVVSVRPVKSVGDDGSEPFEVSLDEIRRMRCEGFVCRTITLETLEDSFQVPAFGLDEGALRQAIAEHSRLSNDCVRLNLDRFGVCPCTVGMKSGCVLTVVGSALVLSVVGALLGAFVLAAGLASLGGAYALRKVGKVRGANVWERNDETELHT